MITDAELERAATARPIAKTEVKTVDVPILKDSHLSRLEASLSRAEKIAERAAVPLEQLQSVAANARAAAQEIRAAITAARAPVDLRRVTSAVAAKGTAVGSPRRIVKAAGAGEKLPPGERATLTAAAQFDGVERQELTVLTGYKRSSRDAYIQRLREKGFVDVQGDRIVPTDAGFTALGDFEPLPMGHELLDWWLPRLPDGERKVLEVLVAAFPEAVERAAIDEATGYQRSSRDAYLQRMKSKRLVEDAGRGMVRASSALFDSEAAR